MSNNNLNRTELDSLRTLSIYQRDVAVTAEIKQHWDEIIDKLTLQLNRLTLY